MRYLLEQGVDINAQTYKGQTALLRAVKKENEDLVGFLLSQNANPFIQDNNKKCPMTFTCATYYKKINENIIAMLKKAAENYPREQQLLFASYWQDFKDLKHILQKETNINVQDAERNTPLMNYVINGDKEAVEYLLIKGALVNIKNRQGETALMLAFERPNEDDENCFNIVALLLTHAADTEIKNRDGNSADKYAQGNDGRKDRRPVYELLKKTYKKIC